jgi:adenylyltransferase/sulfurtransferase
MDTYIVCRLGNDSQVAATALRQTSQSGAVFDVRGGLVAWSKHVDVSFPVY